eukprot:CAMPEP_0185766392 /NCGR_PEP_ID=MMETSP1174-20130828/36582_1 /TAXON_ID=35687 /ORGANISM="Dictyocha speculum, Strain CCMP1381" /LENGTH=78 /DNA_ID=CAMNT_0028450041 /DNA_START=32 /DNA_END=268 /DNA_ORIENTATION=+
MSAILRATTNVAPKILGAKTFVTRTVPRLGGDGVHRVFEGETFKALPMGLAVGGTVVGGISIVVGAILHQNYKHGFLK